MGEVNLKLSRIDDRNLMHTIQSGLLDTSFSQDGNDYVSAEIGAPVWTGMADLSDI